ncbi:cobyrinate a,c-diamide synthase [Bacillus coreaensis]
MTNRRMVIAGTGSGVGKTTITIGLMAALQQKGYVVQGFKCGPDYIDPSYHTAVTGRRSRNLDSWMLSEEVVKEVLLRGSEGADISIIEGVMGFFDGRDCLSNEGSTAHISELTKSPVLLIVNCSSMARSAASIVKGFQLFPHQANIVGVIANRVGSRGHYLLVKKAIEQECGIPVVGYIEKNEDLSIPERHLGLVPSVERGELHAFFTKLGELVNETVDINQIYELAKTEEISPPKESFFTMKNKLKPVRIAVAKDEAFNFYYPENLELLEAHGAELVYFSPVRGEMLPKGVRGLYIGGGFPEEFAGELAGSTDMKQSIYDAITEGLPTIAECGGFMFLTEQLITSGGQAFPMVGVIPGKVTMQKKLVALGYREIKGMPSNPFLKEGTVAKGHEFHYSTYEGPKDLPYAYKARGLRGETLEGYTKGELMGGYTHLHFGSCPQVVEKFISRCRGYIYA